MRGFSTEAPGELVGDAVSWESRCFPFLFWANKLSNSISSLQQGFVAGCSASYDGLRARVCARARSGSNDRSPPCTNYCDRGVGRASHR